MNFLEMPFETYVAWTRRHAHELGHQSTVIYPTNLHPLIAVCVASEQARGIADGSRVESQKGELK